MPNTLSVSISYEIRRYDKTCTFISSVKPLREPEGRSTSTSHFRFFGSCLGASLISSPIEEPLIGTSSFHHETAHGATLNFFQVGALQDRHPYNVVATETNRSLPPWGSKTHPTFLSQVVFFLPLFARKVSRCFITVSLLFNTHSHSGSIGSKPLRSKAPLPNYFNALPLDRCMKTSPCLRFGTRVVTTSGCSWDSAWYARTTGYASNRNLKLMASSIWV